VTRTSCGAARREVIAPRALRRNASPRRSSREVSGEGIASRALHRNAGASRSGREGIGAILQRDPAARSCSAILQREMLA
jgi:hypothetical protein